MSTNEPVLSLIISSRNDQYQGNSVWRLQTSVNFTARCIVETLHDDAVEIIIVDWKSSTPLREALQLTSTAAKITRFLEVPVSMRIDKAKDSPLPEVLSNNAAIVRARGRYIGRIDQDTLVSHGFFDHFFDLAGRGGTGTFSLDASCMFTGRRSVPLEVCEDEPDAQAIYDLVVKGPRRFPKEGRCSSPWFDMPVGIVLASRRLWMECRGYDERLIYWGFMDADLGYRLASRYEIVNLEQFIGCDFYHLKHNRFRIGRTTRKKNPRQRCSTFAPNDEYWGLSRLPLQMHLFPTEASRTVADTSEVQQSRGAVKAYRWVTFKEWCWEHGLNAARFVFYTFCNHNRDR